jgi:DNA-directed RNA polymerases I, II, and III subunit RPABC1
MSDSAMSIGGLSADVTRLYRVRKTCFKLLAKRGYIISEDQTEQDTEGFREQFGDNPSRESMSILVEKQDDNADQIFVFFPEDEKVGVKPIKTYCERMKAENVFKAIIVVKTALTAFAKQAIREVSQRGYRIEYFRDAELVIDITEHKLVPTHTVMTEQEKKELLSRYRLKPSQLPRIQSQDPIARYLGLRTGQVVKITRPSETAGRYITYRICM